MPTSETSKPPELLEALLKRAWKGDDNALQRILQDPNLIDVIGGDLAQQADAGPNPTPIERLLVERVVACWLQVQGADGRYAQAKDLTWKAGEYCQRRMNHSHKRYLSARPISSRRWQAMTVSSRAR